MKRWMIALVACVAAFFVTREIISRFGEVFSGFGAQMPTLRIQQNQPTKTQTVATSLPPFTNLTLYPQRARANPTNQPPAPTTNDFRQTSSSGPGQSLSSAGKIDKPPRLDPLARDALALVGIDPTAEEYWATAINDPNLSEQEREDLIEDLNEEGFADPKNPSPAELPLIVNRLQLIEEFAPYAMDNTNARSFAEAYRDLARMLARLTSQ
jgi:hypothetical protein